AKFHVVMALAVSPDGKLLAVPLEEPVLSLLDPATGKEVRTLRGAHAYQCLCFSADGRLLAGAGFTGGVFVWDVATGNPAGRVPEAANSIALLDGGKLLATASQLGGLKVWELPAGKLVSTLIPEGAALRALALSPD